MSKKNEELKKELYSNYLLELEKNEEYKKLSENDKGVYRVTNVRDSLIKNSVLTTVLLSAPYLFYVAGSVSNINYLYYGAALSGLSAFCLAGPLFEEIRDEYLIYTESKKNRGR